MTTQSTTSAPKLFIGIDIHKRSWKIQTATDLFMGPAFSCHPQSEVLLAWVEKNFPHHDIFCAYEAGCCGFEPVRQFLTFGWNALVFNPADIHRTGISSIHKTDQIDARLICKELRNGRLSPIHIPSVQREELRALFRHRSALVRDFRRIKSRIKMQLLYLGIEFPPHLDTAKWSHACRNWIRSIQCYHPTGDLLIDHMMDQYNYIDLSIRKVSNELRAYCRKHFTLDYRLLRSVPGIGGITACGILSELGDLRRFRSNKQLAAYVGFMPCIRQSGDVSRAMGISPRANHIIRSYFVEASWIAIRQDPALQTYYRKHLGKDSKKIIIKIAHKLLNRARAVIMTKSPYRIGLDS